MKKNTKVAILGCTGYTGLELVNILVNHPNISINFLGSQSFANKNISSFDKRLNNISLPKIDFIKNFNFLDSDVVFFALPQTISQNIIKDNFGKSILIDLSGDFRINDKKIYKENYQFEHQCADLLNKFTYGLPEIYQDSIKISKNIAVPGCYPTSILLPLIPLLKEDLILSNMIIIDSKSGYSGAGKKFDTKNIFKDNEQNFYNYNTNNHRHICEIYQELNKIAKSEVKFSFNPHILPIFRGMMSTIYCQLSPFKKRKDIINIYSKYYKDKSFVKILNSNDTADFFSVTQTNNCLIKLFEHSDNDKIIIVSLIDNLLKGASGQAVQCMNLILGFEENIGLD